MIERIIGVILLLLILGGTVSGTLALWRLTEKAQCQDWLDRMLFPCRR